MVKNLSATNTRDILLKEFSSYYFCEREDIDIGGGVVLVGRCVGSDIFQLSAEIKGRTTPKDRHIEIGIFKCDNKSLQYAVLGSVHILALLQQCCWNGCSLRWS